MYVRVQQKRRITVVGYNYDHTLKIRPDILKMAAICFLSFGGGAFGVVIPLTYFKKHIQIVDETVL